VPPKPGDVIDSRFEILNFLGEGAHGLVFRALDREKSELVALKVLQDAANEPEYSVRLVREAKAMATLTGTAAVQVHGYGIDVDGSFYIAMELLSGVDLEDFLLRLEGLRRPLAPLELLALLGPIADTLEAAHSRGIVHRDVKPGNVFLVDPVPRGGVRLLDFGLVKLMGARRLTKAGVVAGSPSYIAPEAWAGDPDVLDHRLDVYSLGVVIFRALAGRIPFDGADLSAKLAAATKGARPSLHALRPDLPPAVDEWVQRALAIDPARRYQTIRALWDELGAVLQSGA